MPNVRPWLVMTVGWRTYGITSRSPNICSGGQGFTVYSNALLRHEMSSKTFSELHYHVFSRFDVDPDVVSLSIVGFPLIWPVNSGCSYLVFVVPCSRLKAYRPQLKQPYSEGVRSMDMARVLPTCGGHNVRITVFLCTFPVGHGNVFRTS